MKMMLGTVLPNAKKMADNDNHCDRMAKKNERLGDRELAGCEKKIIGGEVRYYDTADQYAIVSRGGKVLWFAVTENGDFRI
jgi:hypothetical protein